MIATTNGEIYFRDGLVISAQASVDDLVRSLDRPRLLAFRATAVPVPDFPSWHQHALGVHPSDHGWFEVEVTSGPDRRVHAVHLRHVERKAAETSEPPVEDALHRLEGVLKADLRGQTEFNWGRAHLTIEEHARPAGAGGRHPADAEARLLILYTEGPPVPLQETESTGHLEDQAPFPEAHARIVPR